MICYSDDDARLYGADALRINGTGKRKLNIFNQKED